MVSLGHNSSSRGSGFFGDDPLQNQDEETLVERGTIVISSDEQPQFKPIRTVWVSIFTIILLVASEVFIFYAPWYCSNGGHCEVVRGISALLYLQVLLWSLLVVLDQYLRFEHRKARNEGFLQFYRKNKVLRRATLYVFSIGNATLLILQVIFQDFCAENESCTSFEPVNYLQLVISIENLVSLPLVVIYLVNTVRFNHRRPVADVDREDLLASYIHVHVPNTEIGYRDEETVDEVIEKQADIIKYLKQHNMKLGRKIVQMTAELQANKSV